MVGAVAFGRIHSGLRAFIALVIFAGMVCSLVSPAFAAGGQSGHLQGVITNGATGQPIAGVTISAASPTGTYTAKTGGDGSFQIVGMNVDTYTVSASSGGFETLVLRGVTLEGDQTVNIGSQALSKVASVIGRTTGRSPSSVFQPAQTTDAYTISGDRILQTTGKTASIDEVALALSVPGVSLTDSGAITIRGGLRTEVGYQLDGVDYTEPFFVNNAGNNRFNGIGSLNVVEGAGDATQAQSAGGTFNLIPKRGTYPGFGYLDLEVGGPNYRNQYGFEYGAAAKDGRWSNYVSYTGVRTNPPNGYSNSNAAAYGNFFNPAYQQSDQFLDNFVFKFGKDLNQSLQVLYVNSDFVSEGLYGGVAGRSWYPVDPNNPVGADFFGPAYSQFVPLNPDVPANFNGAPPSNFVTGWNPARFLKFEYDNNIDASTFLRLRYYNWETLQGSSNDIGSTQIASSLGIGAYPTENETGGPRVGATLDLQHQFGRALTVSVALKYETAFPIWNGYDPNALIFLLGAGAGAPSTADFLPGGYLTPFFPGGVPRVPNAGINYNGAWFQTYGGGLRLQYDLGKLKLDLGAREDVQRQHYGINPFNSGDPSNPSDVNPATITSYYLDPWEFQPRGAISYQFDPNDAVRGGYGRSAIFLNAQTAGTPAAMFNAAPFLNVPAPPGSVCGSGVAGAPVLTCRNYADALFWMYDQNFDAPDLGGARPAVYSNYDFTYQHQFSNGVALKLTPFYKYGTNLPAFALVSGLSQGSFVFTVNNQGVNRTTGVEFGLSTKSVTYGFSSFLSATYQNVLQSTPPLGSGEDSLPVNGSGSLILGDTYRAGYVSPGVIRLGGEYKSKGGFRINPVLQFDAGYPYSVGTTIASSAPLPDGSFHNIPQVNFGAGTTQVVGYQVGGTDGSTAYYDPSYSGTQLNPNIAATRGTPATSSSGGKLWHPELRLDLTLEYIRGRNTLGMQISNLGGSWYNGVVPIVNPYYQPVANGLSGPRTSTNPFTTVYPGSGFANIPTDTYAFTNGAYVLLPGTGAIPNTVNVYYQYKF
jgi:hypothetical protein